MSAASVVYDGQFELVWLAEDERVMSAGDGTGAAIIVSPRGQRRVNVGDRIEVHRTGAREAEGSGLLSRPAGNSRAGSNPAPSAWSRARLTRIDECMANGRRRRGLRLRWLTRRQTEPPFHYAHRCFEAHVMTWGRQPDLPAFKVQFEVKTYRTAGSRSVDGSKRYVRFGVCL